MSKSPLRAQEVCSHFVIATALSIAFSQSIGDKTSIRVKMEFIDDGGKVACCHDYVGVRILAHAQSYCNTG